MKRIVCLLMMIIIILSGCSANSLFQSKEVRINENKISFPITVKDFISETNISEDKFDQTLATKETTLINLSEFSIYVVNESKENIDIMDASIIGIYQDIDQINNGAIPIVFPEKISVGMEADPDNIADLLLNGSDIKGDVGITNNSSKTEYDLICGKRIVNLNGDFIDASKEVIYPVEISIKNNIITKIQMTFIDQ